MVIVTLREGAMIYECIHILESGVKCDGQVGFDPEQKRRLPSSDSKEPKTFQIILDVKDNIVACPKCGTSYFEWELKSS